MSNKPTAKGTTVIVHAIREKLGLTIEDYVFCDVIYQLEQQKIPATSKEIERIAGSDMIYFFAGDHIPLKQKGLVDAIVDKEGIYTYSTTDLWKKEFEIDKSMSDDFEEFWLIWQRRAKNKTKTLAKYIKARKKVDKETLHRRARLVAESASEWKFIPHAEGWLDNERWNEFNPKFDTPDTTTETQQQGFQFVG
jgi:hypothetical protein